MIRGTSSASFSAPTVVILGTDLLLTARPATPVQLAHACHAAGYTAALPVSWGDELLASALALRASARAGGPVIACVCPHVADRFSGELDKFLLPVASPPVATARYVRELYGAPVHITYVGACPGANDPSIDARYTPGEFLARIRELGIEVEEQPVVFESVIPPDRRRYESLPGGIPTTDALRRAGASHALLELEGDDYIIALAQRLFEREAVLIDVAPRLGCACSGALNAGSLRAAVAALEPPRARTPVVEASVRVDVDAPARPPRVTVVPEPAAAVAAAVPHFAPPPPPPPPAPAPAPAPVAQVAAPTAPPDEPPPTEPEEEPAFEAPSVPVVAHADLPDERGRHRSPAVGVPRFGSGTPVSRTRQGRVVPRAYLRRRRPWADLDDTPDASPHAPRHPDEPRPADLATDRPPVERDRQAPIATHVEPTVDASEMRADVPSVIGAERATERVVEAPPPHDVEVPLSRTPVLMLVAADLVPPPPIMPDLHLGDSLMAADSLSDLFDLEATFGARTYTDDLPEITEPATLYAAAPPAPVARRVQREVPVSARERVEEEPRTPPPETQATPPVSTPAPVETPPPAVVVPKATVPAPSERAIPTPAPPAPAPAPRVSRGRAPVLLPPRRRSTATVLWLLLGALVALTILSVRLLFTERTATASPRADSIPAAASEPVLTDSMMTPILPPVIVDSTRPAAESTTTPNLTPPTEAAPPAPPETTGVRPAPARRVPARARQAPLPTPTTGRTPIGTPPGRRPGPTISVRQPPVSAPVPPPSLGDSARLAPPTAGADSADSLGFNTPRVTRPWPPPEQR
jgi:hypothetical protein